MDSYRKMHTWLAATLMAALLGGCAQVETAQPVAAHPTPLDQAQFEGAWQAAGSDDVVTVRFTCDGVAHFAGVEWEDGKFVMHQGEMVVTQGKQADGRFMSLRFRDGGKWMGYMLARYEFASPVDLVLWFPNVPAFQDAVKSGKLKGKATDHEVTITSTPDELLDFIEHTDNPALFNYPQPFLFRKVAPAEKVGACPKK